MSASHSDLLTAFLELVRNAAREGVAEALAGQCSIPGSSLGSLLDKRGLAHALGVSSATIDRLCRDGRIPFVRVGDVRRFDMIAVRAVLDEGAGGERSTRPSKDPPKQSHVPGIRLLSRGSR